MQRIAALFVLTFLPYPAQAQKSTPPVPPAQVAQEVHAWRVGNEDRIVRELIEFLTIPDAASDTPNIQRTAARLVELLEARGIETHVFPIAGRGPVVFGKLITPEAARTVIFYSHYDGQPVDPAAWMSGKLFEPALFTKAIEGGGKQIPFPRGHSGRPGVYEDEWRIHARSTPGGKSSIVMLLAALDALRARNIPLAVNLKVIFEGEGEAASPNLERTLGLHKNLLDGDLLLMLAGPLDSSGQPVVTLAMGDAHLSEKIVGVVEGAAGPAARVPVPENNMPARVFANLGLPIAGVAIVNSHGHDNKDNEYVRLGELWRALEVYGALLANLKW